jgi:hypothetical protein
MTAPRCACISARSRSAAKSANQLCSGSGRCRSCPWSIHQVLSWAMSQWSAVRHFLHLACQPPHVEVTGCQSEVYARVGVCCWLWRGASIKGAYSRYEYLQFCKLHLMCCRLKSHPPLAAVRPCCATPATTVGRYLGWMYHEPIVVELLLAPHHRPGPELLPALISTGRQGVSACWLLVPSS